MNYTKPIFWMVLIALLIGGGAVSAGEKKAKVAVMDLGDKGVGAKAALLLSSVVAGQLDSYGLFEVVSREDIRKLLNLEEDKSMLGCSDDSCLAEIGGALDVDMMVAGDVGLVGKTYLITLRLMDVRGVKVLNRVERSHEGSLGDLMAEVRLATHQLVEKVLKAESGTLLFSVSEEGADISVDGKVVGISPLKGVEFPAGPHEVRVAKQGFVDWARTVKVQPRATEMVEVSLIPSASFIEAYERETASMRRWAWISTAVFIALEGAAVGLRVYTWQKYDPIVADYNDGNYEKRDFPNQSAFYEHYKDDIKLADTLDYAALGMGITGLVVGGIGLYLFLEGEDPNRYEQFSGVKVESTASLLMPDSGGFAPAPGGGSVTLGWGF